MAIGVRDGTFSTDAVIAADLKLKGPGWPARSAGRRVLEDELCPGEPSVNRDGNVEQACTNGKIKCGLEVFC